MQSTMARRVGKHAGGHRPAIVRYAMDCDLSALVAIEQASHAYPWTGGFLGHMFATPHTVWRVADVGGRPVGFTVEAELRPDLIRLENMAVLPQFRRQGIGQLLLAQIQASGLDIVAEIGERNLCGQLFLSAAGFRYLETLPGFYNWPSQDAYRFYFSQPEEGAKRWKTRNK